MRVSTATHLLTTRKWSEELKSQFVIRGCTVAPEAEVTDSTTWYVPVEKSGQKADALLDFDKHLKEKVLMGVFGWGSRGYPRSWRYHQGSPSVKTFVQAYLSKRPPDNYKTIENGGKKNNSRFYINRKQICKSTFFM